MSPDPSQQLPLLKWMNSILEYVRTSDPGLDGRSIEWIAVGLVAVTTLGIVLGWKVRRIVVYRDVTDVVLSGALLLVPLATVAGYFLLSRDVDGDGPVGWLVSLVTPALLLVVMVRTFADNRNPIYFVIAFITKIILGIFLDLLLIQAVMPSGEKPEDRGRVRSAAFLGLAALSPVAFNLIASFHKKTHSRPPKSAAPAEIREQFHKAMEELSVANASIGSDSSIKSVLPKALGAEMDVKHSNGRSIEKGFESTAPGPGKRFLAKFWIALKFLLFLYVCAVAAYALFKG